MGKLTRSLAILASSAIAIAAAYGEAGKGENKGWYIKDGDFSLQTEFALQTGFNYLEDNFEFTGELFDGAVDTEVDPKLDFRVKLARANFSGTAFFPWLSWKLQTEFASGSPRLRDAWIQIRKSDRNGWQFGQFKSPFDIYKLTPASYNTFIERPDGTRLLWERTRDIGVMYIGNTADRRVNWAVALQNGNGDNRDGNDNDKFMTTVRFEVQNEGGYEYRASAVDHPASLQYTAGVAWMQNPQGGLEGAQTVGGCVVGTDFKCDYKTVDRDALEAFLALRGGRWQLTSSIQRWNFEDGVTDENGDPKDSDLDYFNLDFGFFVSDRDELIGRWGVWEFKQFSFDSLGEGDRQEGDEWRVGYVHYFSGHNLKLGLDYGSSTVSTELEIAGSTGEEQARTEGLRFLLSFLI
jgi:hypothetical protein